MSWRDTASDSAQDDMDLLLNVALPFAEEMLADSGEFYPYGAAVDSSGEARMIAAAPPDDRPDSTELIEMLVAGFRADSDDFRAVAIVADVATADGDAIRVETEHVEGIAIDVLLPYSVRRGFRGRRIDYGELSAQAASPRIWN